MELGLGAAQFGFDYGVLNEEGKVSAGNVRTLLKIAYENDIRVIDTAATYGDSETVLGQSIPQGFSFRIMTKLPPMKKDSICEKDSALINENFYGSLKKLRMERISGLFLHCPNDLFLPGGDIIYTTLLSFKDRGLVEKIGVSVYNGDEIDHLFHHYDFDLIQLPLNVLDQRLVKSGHIARLKAKDVEIHARSVFLQGILLIPLDKINPFFNPILSVLTKYRDFLEEYRLSPVEGALSYLRTVEELDIVLVGVTNEKQLRENINAFKLKLPDSLDFSEFVIENIKMLNPYHWKLV